MPAAWISAGAGLLGAYSASKSGGGGQGGTTTQNRDPWAPAQPWMQQNIATGQNLQNYYQKNPFNAQQVGAYNNLASGNDYINRMTPGLLAQFSESGGFDRNNPNAKPEAFNFAAPYNPSQAGQFGGVMGASAPGGFNATSNAPNPTLNFNQPNTTTRPNLDTYKNGRYTMLP